MRLTIVMAAMIAVLSLDPDNAGARSPRPDFATVTTPSAAQDLASRGVLSKILLFPEIFGGQDIAENRAYIPFAALHGYDLAIDALALAVPERGLTKLTVTPRYTGQSVIPSSIHYHAAGDGTPFEMVVEVW
jgi:hypothetical protein